MPVYKLFISQPMKNLTREEIEEARQQALEKVRKVIGEDAKVELIDQIDPDHDSKDPLKLLAASLEKMSDATLVYFADGWQMVRGCRIEHTCAVEYGLAVLEAYK